MSFTGCRDPKEPPEPWERRFGLNSGHFGQFWGFGEILGDFPEILGISGGFWGNLGEILGDFQVIFWAILGDFREILEISGGFWGIFGEILGIFAGFWGNFGGFLGRF